MPNTRLPTSVAKSGPEAPNTPNAKAKAPVPTTCTLPKSLYCVQPVSASGAGSIMQPLTQALLQGTVMTAKSAGAGHQKAEPHCRYLTRYQQATTSA